jgi:hypothetical protein
MRGPTLGAVHSFDEDALCADVLPLIARSESESPQVLRGVPVLFCAGVAYPLPTGAHVLLIPCECDISGWKLTRAATKAQTPRTFALADCVCVPVWFPVSTHVAAWQSGVDTLLSTLSTWALALQGATGVIPPDLASIVTGGDTSVG